MDLDCFSAPEMNTVDDDMISKVSKKNISLLTNSIFLKAVCWLLIHVYIFSGALIVKNTSAAVLKKKYFGGGSVSMSLPTERIYKSRDTLSEK